MPVNRWFSAITWVLGLKPSPLQEQQVLLTTEPRSHDLSTHCSHHLFMHQDCMAYLFPFYHSSCFYISLFSTSFLNNLLLKATEYAQKQEFLEKTGHKRLSRWIAIARKLST